MSLLNSNFFQTLVMFLVGLFTFVIYGFQKLSERRSIQNIVIAEVVETYKNSMAFKDMCGSLLLLLTEPDKNIEAIKTMIRRNPQVNYQLFFNTSNQLTKIRFVFTDDDYMLLKKYYRCISEIGNIQSAIYKQVEEHEIDKKVIIDLITRQLEEEIIDLEDYKNMLRVHAKFKKCFYQ